MLPSRVYSPGKWQAVGFGSEGSGWDFNLLEVEKVWTCFVSLNFPPALAYHFGFSLSSRRSSVVPSKALGMRLLALPPPLESNTLLHPLKPLFKVSVKVIFKCSFSSWKETRAWEAESSLIPPCNPKEKLGKLRLWFWQKASRREAGEAFCFVFFPWVMSRFGSLDTCWHDYSLPFYFLKVIQENMYWWGLSERRS